MGLLHLFCGILLLDEQIGSFLQGEMGQMGRVLLPGLLFGSGGWFLLDTQSALQGIVFNQQPVVHGSALLKL